MLDTILRMVSPGTGKDYAASDQIINRLRLIAAPLRAGVVLLNHFDKTGEHPLGSTGIMAACRSRLLAEPDPDSREKFQFVLRPVVNSYASTTGMPVPWEYETVQEGDMILPRWGGQAPELATKATLDAEWQISLQELILTVLVRGPMRWKRRKANEGELGILEAVQAMESVGASALVAARSRLKDRRLIKKRRIGGGPGSSIVWFLPEHQDQVDAMVRTQTPL